MSPRAQTGFELISSSCLSLLSAGAAIASARHHVVQLVGRSQWPGGICFAVSITHEDWCWRNKSLELEVLEDDVSSLEFRQTGYMLRCVLSHAITLVSAAFEGLQREYPVGSARWLSL